MKCCKSKLSWNTPYGWLELFDVDKNQLDDKPTCILGSFLGDGAAGTDLEVGRWWGGPTINGRLVVSLSPHRFGGWWGKILGANRPKFGAEGAFLENFSNIFKKIT